MTPKPRVSVIVPTRDRLDLLRQTIDSVRAQVGTTWELIVVDDASSDGTRAFLEAQPDVRPIILECPHERSASRNAGMARAEGDYLYLLDSDDRLVPDGLATLARTADENAGSCVVGGWRYVPGSSGSMRLFNATKPAVADWREVLFGWTPQLGQLLAPRSAVEASGGFDPKLTFAEDLDFLLRLALSTPLVAIPNVVLEYRAHAGQRRPDDAELIDAGVRRRFVDSLDGEDHRRGEAILASRAHFRRGHDHYLSHHYPAATAELMRSLRRAPWIARSQVLRSYLVGLCLKAAALTLLPRSLATRVRSRLGERRASS